MDHSELRERTFRDLKMLACFLIESTAYDFDYTPGSITIHGTRDSVVYDHESAGGLFEALAADAVDPASFSTWGELEDLLEAGQ